MQYLFKLRHFNQHHVMSVMCTYIDFYFPTNRLTFDPIPNENENKLIFFLKSGCKELYNCLNIFNP